MVVCKFYEQGNCRFGDKCRFEHPKGRNGPFQGQTRFPALQSVPSGSSGGGRGDSRPPFGGQQRQSDFYVDPKIIEDDLRYQRPEWIFSAYGPGKDAPRELFGGYPLEQSFEEMRVMFYAAQASGKAQVAIAQENELRRIAQQQITTALRDLKGAVKYIQDGADVHPNRLDICRGSSQSNLQQHNQAPLGAPHGPPPAFGSPSALGTAHSQPTFGQPSFGQRPAFGQPGGGGTFGQPSFSKPSGFGGNQAPSFGQPSALGPSGPSPLAQGAAHTAGTFGQPSAPTGAFNQPTQSSPFGQPAQPSQGGSFGRPSFGQPPQPGTFGQPSRPGSFGQPSQPPQPGGFGQPSQPGAFGQPSQPMGFGQPSASPFAAATATGGFNQPSQPIPNGTAAAPSPFARPSTQAPAANGFGESAPAPSAPNISGRVPDSVSSYTTRDGSNRLTSWKGLPVSYIEDQPHYKPVGSNDWERIWFPDGAPPQNKWAEVASELYDRELQEAYRLVREEGKFKDGIMPELPPKQEWVRWDL